MEVKVDGLNFEKRDLFFVEWGVIVFGIVDFVEKVVFIYYVYCFWCNGEFLLGVVEVFDFFVCFNKFELVKFCILFF